MNLNIWIFLFNQMNAHIWNLVLFSINGIPHPSQFRFRHLHQPIKKCSYVRVLALHVILINNLDMYRIWCNFCSIICICTIRPTPHPPLSHPRRQPPPSIHPVSPCCAYTFAVVLLFANLWVGSICVTRLVHWVEGGGSHSNIVWRGARLPSFGYIQGWSAWLWYGSEQTPQEPGNIICRPMCFELKSR